MSMIGSALGAQPGLGLMWRGNACIALVLAREGMRVCGVRKCRGECRGGGLAGWNG